MAVNMFSLEEEDDYGDLFITQTPSKVVDNCVKESIEMFDLTSPVVPDWQNTLCHYSDISDPTLEWDFPWYLDSVGM